MVIKAVDDISWEHVEDLAKNALRGETYSQRDLQGVVKSIASWVLQNGRYPLPWEINVRTR